MALKFQTPPDPVTGIRKPLTGGAVAVVAGLAVVSGVVGIVLHTLVAFALIELVAGIDLNFDQALAAGLGLYILNR